MFQLCTQKDNEVLLQYLSQDVILHTFLIADIEQYGFDKPYQQVYMDGDETNPCTAVALRYYSNLIISGNAHTMDFKALSTLCTPNITNVMGEDCLLDGLEFHLPAYTHQRKTLFTLTQGDTLRLSTQAKRATLADVDDIYTFLMTIDEIKHLYAQKQMIANRIATGEGAHFVIRKDGKVIAHCNSAAGTDATSMIGGLAVAPAYRHQGLGREILETVCNDILQHKKTPCLFDKAQGEDGLVRQVGFCPYKRWGMLLAPVKQPSNQSN